MLATPPRPRNAVTEHSITPLCAKTSSVPLDGRILKAVTIDAELANELENVSVHEQAGRKLQDSYIVFWCQLSTLKDLSRIKARELKTEKRAPLFLSGHWDPTLIPVTLHQPQSLSTGAADSVESNSLTGPAKCQSKASRRQTAASTSHTGPKNPSLRREPITRTIPNTSVQETIEVTVLPLVGSEEASVATWLNQIVTSFPVPRHANESCPEGWGAERPVTRSSTKQTKSAHPLRAWSSQYATRAVENSQLSVKPDVVFCGQLDLQGGFAWQNVITFLELTSSVYGAQLQRNIVRKAYAIFMSQPCRRFVVALSIAHQEFCLHLFDRSGAIHSLGYNLHKFADLFIHVIYVFAFGKPAVLGFDTTFVDATVSPSFIHRPCSGSAIQKARLIYIRKIAYAVVRPIFISHLIRGRATSSWLVKRGKKQYVIKDYWTHKGRKFTEEEILKKIAGLLGVPELVNSWTVQVDGVDETTDLLRPAFVVSGVSFETRIHRRLLMTPVGEPLVGFSSLQELVSVFIDIVDVHYFLVDVHGILHRDISVNNILMYVCQSRFPASLDAHKKREDIVADKEFRRGLLIDFDYASMLNTERQGVSSGDRTGTIPFMAIDLLREFIKPSNDFVHTFSHDLESLIYVLVWICVLYQAPNKIRRDKTIEQTCLKQWGLAKTTNDIEALHDQNLKLGQLLSKTVFDHFTPYFEPMKSSVSQLYKLIQKSRDPDDGIPLTHVAVKDVLMDSFNTIEEVTCGAVNAQRVWKNLRRGPAPMQLEYCSEGRNVRRRLA